MRRLRWAVMFVAFALGWANAAHAWDEIQAVVAREAADCVSWSARRIDCFARSPSGSLVWTHRDKGVWSAPQDLGGKLAAAPSCIVRGPGGINCFAISAKGVLATIYLNGVKWSAWASLGGELKPSRVSCVSSARDRIACFARGRGDQLVTRRWNGGKAWEPWRNLGGALTADPDCIIVGAGNAACFARGASGELVAFLPDAGGRSGGWTTLGGRIEGRPSCVRLKSGDAACAAPSRSGRLHVWRGMPFFGQNPGLITSTDENVTAEPACALDAGAFVCFTRNSRGLLVRRSLGNGADTTHDGLVEAPLTAAIACLSFGEAGIGCALTDTDRRLHFASDASLRPDAADEPAGPAEARTETGEWYLSNLATRETCRVQLTDDVAFGAKRLRVQRRCRAVDLPARPAQWDDDDDDEIVFLAADGRILMRFEQTESGRWVSAASGAGFLLSREAPGETGEPAMARPADGQEAELVGPWRVTADGIGPLCTIRLTNARIDDGFAIRPDPDCDPRFMAVRYWTESGAALVFVGPGNVVVARFDSAGPGSWRSQALGGLTLTR